MKYWKVRFIMDNGAVHDKMVALVTADSEEEAIKTTREYFYSHYKGSDECILEDTITVEKHELSNCSANVFFLGKDDEE